MGIYTEHWRQHDQRARRGAIIGLLILGLGLPATGALAYLSGLITAFDPIALQIGVVLLWVIAVTTVAIRFSRVTCPRCGRVYTQGRGTLPSCPKCGLRMLQEDE